MIILTILGWVFTAIFGSLALSMLLLKNYAAFFVLLLILVLVMPVTVKSLYRRLSIKGQPVIHGLILLALLFSLQRILIGDGLDSIYFSEEVREEFHRLYEEKMGEWPGEYESRFLDSEYGRIHVIISGDETKPPLLLLHASGVASWSWKINAMELGKHYRLYAVDTIGDAGLSEYDSIGNVLTTGKEQADLYREIMDQLSIDSAYVMGASEGGFIGTNLAIHYPEKVRKLILAGPMGYAGAGSAVLRITLTQIFPLKAVQKSTVKWAFGKNEEVIEEFGEWFALLMTGTAPKKVAPLPFSPEQRQSLSVPVLFIFGERDNLVGDPRKAEEKVQDIPGVQVRIVKAGHLVAGERPDLVNPLVLGFFGEE